MSNKSDVYEGVGGQAATKAPSLMDDYNTIWQFSYSYPGGDKARDALKRMLLAASRDTDPPLRPTPVDCPTCKGFGNVCVDPYDLTREACPDCKGTGAAPIQSSDGGVEGHAGTGDQLAGYESARPNGSEYQPLTPAGHSPEQSERNRDRKEAGIKPGPSDAHRSLALTDAMHSLLAFRHGDTKHFTQEHAREIYAALAATRDGADTAGVREKTEEIAKWLHDETNHPESYPNHTWPETDRDDGQREGGFLKIVPQHGQAYFRDIARRLVTQFPLTSPPLADTGLEGLKNALRDVRQDLWVDYCLQRGRTDTDPRQFDAKPHIRIIDCALPQPASGGETGLCSDCPPVGYETDRTRCLPCPRSQHSRPDSTSGAK